MKPMKGIIMAGKRQEQVSPTGFQMGEQDGYLQVLAWEQLKFGSSEQRFNTTIETYEVQESAKGREITVTVNVGERETGRKAEWAGFMAVKARHASVYAESKMALRRGNDWIVMVRWMVWKPQEQTGGIDF